MSVREIERAMRTCRHFTGLPICGANPGTCAAGVDYRALVGGEDFGWAARTPCTGRDGAGVVPCPLRETPTREQAEREWEEREASIQAYLDSLFKKRICPHCAAHYEGRQHGPCVYCEHCGFRLFQGKVQEAQA